MAYIVITENCYGGDSNLKVFLLESDAQAFAETIPKSIDTAVFQSPLFQATIGKPVFIVVTEEYYGGGQDKIKLFTDYQTAEDYQKSISKENLDVIVLERLLE